MPAIGDAHEDMPTQDETIRKPGDIVDIHPAGDLVLRVLHQIGSSSPSHRFRVDSGTLRASSKYFAGLLSGRFGESERIGKEHERLRKTYHTLQYAPAEEMPEITIEDIGRISAVKSIEPLCADFLLLLHGKDLPSAPPVANLANLAAVADRFDALDTARAYCRRKRLIRSIDAKTTPKVDNALSEEKVRQRVLVALLLDYGPWLEKYTTRLIVKGWTGRETSDLAALWWDLPTRLEEELAVRRESILDTLQSLQACFVRLYISRERQCRLGYDSSAQCDSFQLGEMVRFFNRIGTLSLRGTINNTSDDDPRFERDINTLLDSMRQIPEYQIDRNHSHCGIRTRLVPLLNFLEDALHYVGVCADCWAAKRLETAWMEGKPPLLWRKQAFRWQNPACKDAHGSAKVLFTATERDWLTA